MPLLTDVRQTDTGLEGTAASGEIVKLSEPVSKLEVVDCLPTEGAKKIEEDWDDLLEDVINEIIIPKLKPDTYIQIGERKIHLYKSGISLSYNLYKKRE